MTTGNAEPDVLAIADTGSLSRRIANAIWSSYLSSRSRPETVCACGGNGWCDPCTARAADAVVSLLRSMDADQRVVWTGEAPKEVRP